MFIIHGWMGHKDSDLNNLISEALLKIKGGGRIARNVNYFKVAAAVLEVGEIIANFIKKIKKYAGLDIEKLHPCGHSLGAHVAGRAGEKLQGKVKSIVDKINA